MPTRSPSGSLPRVAVLAAHLTGLSQGTTTELVVERGSRAVEGDENNLDGNLGPSGNRINVVLQFRFLADGNLANGCGST